MLADRAKINVRGGAGGAGAVSFRREAHVPKGGPDGGDGGRGGAVILLASRQARDLARFQRRIHFAAASGTPGRGASRHGADGEDLVVEVPVGTEVHTLQEELLADLAVEGQRVRVAEGGEGGRGNARFVSSRRRAPAFAEHGLPGQERWLLLTMKLLADVGLVGLPNAGKSSLLAALTRARPKVAAYPFTTLEPNLGVLEAGERRLVLADIPGLMEGASEGVGLGHQFLAHVERTAVLVYTLDASKGVSAVLQAFGTVREELSAFQSALVRRPAVAALTKADLVDQPTLLHTRSTLAAAASGIACVAVSSVDRRGLGALVEAIVEVMQARVETASVDAAPAVLHPGAERASSFVVQREPDGFRVRGAVLERLVAKADLDNEEAVAYLQHVMERAGVSDALRRAGAVPGDAVLIGEQEFEFS